jgi:hypothetical protein
MAGPAGPNTTICVPLSTRPMKRDGRAYYDKKVAEGKTAKEALRALKRQVSDEIFKHLKAGAARAPRAVTASGPGGQPGNDSVASAAGSHPERRLFGQATPGPAPTLRSRPHPCEEGRTQHDEKDQPNPLTQRGLDMAPITASQHDSLYRARAGILAPVHADDSRRTSPPGLMPEDAGNLVDGETTVTRYHLARIL